MRELQQRRRAATAAENHELLKLGLELRRLRRRCRRLAKARLDDWASWSATVEETTRIARRIGKVRPVSSAGLLVRYEALAWLLVEQDDAIIMDDEAKRAFVAFGRALRRIAPDGA